MFPEFFQKRNSIFMENSFKQKHCPTGSPSLSPTTSPTVCVPLGGSFKLVHSSVIVLQEVRITRGVGNSVSRISNFQRKSAGKLE